MPLIPASSRLPSADQATGYGPHRSLVGRKRVSQRKPLPSGLTTAVSYVELRPRRFAVAKAISVGPQAGAETAPVRIVRTDRVARSITFSLPRALLNVSVGFWTYARPAESGEKLS